jgi:transcriptional regulator with XRE-family HTH domain
MSHRPRVVDDARLAWLRRRIEIGADLRSQRKLLGATQAQVGEAFGISPSEVSRRERGSAPSMTVRSLCEHAAAVGLRVSVTMHPSAAAVRDAGQVRAMHRFLDRVSDAFHPELEAVIPLPGDLRAVDVVLRAAGILIAVEVVTRLVDLQALLRSARLKARDIGATRLVIVVTGTRGNRRILDDARPVLLSSWDLDTRRVLAILAAGRQPERDAIVVI